MAEKLRRGLYVDNVITGADNVEQARALYSEANQYSHKHQ